MKPIHLIVALLALAVIVLLLLWPSVEPYDVSVWKDSIRESEVRIKTLKQELVSLRQEATQDSLQGVKERQEYETTIKKQRSVISDLKASPVVIHVRDSVPEIDSLIVAYDSAIFTQDNRIAALTHQLGKLQVSMVGITANFESQIAAHVQRFEAQKALTDDYKKQVRKERRAKRLAILVGAVGIVGALFVH